MADRRKPREGAPRADIVADQSAGGASTRLRLRAGALELRALDAAVIDGFLRGDRTALAAWAGATLPEPLAPPPYLAGALRLQADQLRAHPEEVGWWGWVVIDRDGDAVVGVVTLAGPPDAGGGILVGYSIYPAYAQRGYATAAARALLTWAAAQPGVRFVRATPPPWYAPSIRVAEKLGLRATGRRPDPSAGEVLLFEAPAGLYAGTAEGPP